MFGLCGFCLFLLTYLFMYALSVCVACLIDCCYVLLFVLLFVCVVVCLLHVFCLRVLFLLSSPCSVSVARLGLFVCVFGFCVSRCVAYFVC